MEVLKQNIILNEISFGVVTYIQNPTTGNGNQARHCRGIPFKAHIPHKHRVFNEKISHVTQLCTRSGPLFPTTRQGELYFLQLEI